jgi:hypothetical protein
MKGKILSTQIKRLLCFFFSLIYSLHGYSQGIEGLFTKKLLPCNEIIYNCSLLIPEHYEKQNLDTVAALVNYWEEHCGLNEELLRLKILLSIKGDSLNENIYSDVSIIKALLLYRNRKIEEKNSPGYLKSYYGFGISAGYDNFTKNLANSLVKDTTNSALEQFFLEFYSNNFDKIFLKLQDSSLHHTSLQKAYKTEEKTLSKKLDPHISLFSGILVPLGNLKIVGNRPIFGIKGGFNKKNFLLDAALDFRFGPSKNTYFVQYQDSLIKTKQFFGVLFGLETGYRLFNQKMNEIDLLGGIGLDGIDVLNIGKPEDPNRITKSLNSLNLNLGIGFRHYFQNRTYWGIEARYNFVNFKNTGGTDLTGNTISIRLNIGLSRNYYADRRLMFLDNKEQIQNQEKYYNWLKRQKENFRLH